MNENTSVQITGDKLPGTDKEVEKMSRVKKNDRDYSKPILLNLRGKDGFRTYVKIVTSPKVRYDAKTASQEAAKYLREQGLKL